MLQMIFGILAGWCAISVAVGFLLAQCIRFGLKDREETLPLQKQFERDHGAIPLPLLRKQAS